ncbi:MAG: tRNA uridine-5-carboxymethylaminomethyl(34) synthesis GTPase MnmE [Steroidobacteraceae bacterium]
MSCSISSPPVMNTDTIVAAATPPGRGGIGIVRLSGPQVSRIGVAMVGELPAARFASPRTFLEADGGALDHGLALYFVAPHSFTGEDVLELHGHGSPVVLESLVARAVQLGARRALPGEFTQRAYLNDKLDLAQAEAVADLIDAGSRAAARAALRSLQGEFSARVHALLQGLIELRVHVEAAIDFPEEEIDFLADAQLLARLAQVRALHAALTTSAVQGRLLREGMTVVIAGRPNAGKSTLLNALAGHAAAIVSEHAGTTRDLLRERIDLDGMPLHVIDTAGLRAPGEDIGPVEMEGMRRAREQLQQADRLLFVIDGAMDPQAHAYDEERARLPPGLPVTLLLNKRDLMPQVPAAQSEPPRLSISAATGAGLDDLRAHLRATMGYAGEETGQLSARGRHVAALQACRAHVDSAAASLAAKQGELVAEELRLAQRALGEITGEFDSDELLGRIFSSFCIGK